MNACLGILTVSPPFPIPLNPGKHAAVPIKYTEKTAFR